MKKLIFTCMLSLSLIGLTKATVIFDPATYAGTLPAGMEIVDVGGTSYLRVVLNGWNSTLTLDAAVDLRASETMFKTASKFAVGTSGFALSNINSFIQLMSAGGNKAIVAQATADFSKLSAAATASMNITAIQFAGQERTNWDAVVGDTIWVGKIVGYNPSAVFDPSTFEGTLPAGMSIVDIGGEMYLKAALNDWNTTLAIDEFVIETATYNRFKANAKYQVGTGGFALANINTFIQLANSDYSKKASAAAQATVDFTEYVANIDVNFTASQLQLAGQERTDWKAIVGDTLWIGVIEVYKEGGNEPVYATPRIIANAYPVDAEGIVIDGLDTDETWFNIDNFTPIVNTDSTANPNAAFQGEMLLAWDPNYLYIYLNVKDATPFEYDGADSWKKDGIQAYFDVRNQLLEGDRVPIRQHQITVPYTTVAEDEAFSSYSDADLTPYYAADTNEFYGDYACVSSSSGYSMELRVPFAAMYYNGDNVDTWEKCLAAVNVAAGKLVGFNMQLNNYNSGTGNREHVTTWSGYSTDEGDSYVNSGVWGAVRLFDPNNAVKENAELAFVMYPNPANSSVTLKMNGMQVITVIDVTGRIVANQLVNADVATLNVSSLNSGIYLVQVQSTQGLAVQKLRIK